MEAFLAIQICYRKAEVNKVKYVKKIIANIFYLFGYELSTTNRIHYISEYISIDKKLSIRKIIMTPTYKRFKRLEGITGTIYKFNLPESSSYKNLVKLQLSSNWLFDMYKSSLDEFLSLRSIFCNMNGNKQLTIVDLGGGLGRSSIFLFNSNKWLDNKLIIVDKSRPLDYLENEWDKSRRGNRSMFKTGYHKSKVSYDESTYTNFSLLEEGLKLNNINKYSILDLDQFSCSNEKIDVLYSFHSVGYHYSIQHSINEHNLLDKMNKDGILIFGIRNKDKMDDVHDYEIPLTPPAGLQLINKIYGRNRQDYLVYKKI